MAVAIRRARERVIESVQVPRFVVFSLKNNRVVCSDSGCESSDALAKKAYAMMGIVDRYFREIFNLSVFNQRSPVRVEIDWDTQNAVCSCSSLLNGREVSCSFKFNNKFIDPKIIAHEYVHAIIRHVSQLGYFGQAGALNESLADCLAMAFYKWATGQHPDWRIVDRDLAKCPRGLISQNDVHAMSVIPSHAFYKVVQNTPAKRIAAAALIWFSAMKQSQANETFKSFAAKTIAIAEVMDPRFAQIIRRSWSHVGVV
jgi:Zn-dependent metalloprotease